MVRGCWLLCVMVGLSLASSVARADELPVPPRSPSSAELARAKESFGRGVEHADHGQWTSAVLAFEEAYRRSGNPVALFNWASALRETGQLDAAHQAVQTLLARHGDTLDAATRERAEALEHDTAPATPAASGAQPLPTAASPPAADRVPLPAPASSLAPVAVDSEPPGWWRRHKVWLSVLAGVVVVGAVTATSLALTRDQGLEAPAGAAAVYRMP